MRRSKPNATFPLNERGVLRPPPAAASPVSRSKPNANPFRWKDETGEASVVEGDPGGVASAIEGDLERSRSFSKRSSKDNTKGTSLSEASSPMQEIGEVAISPLKLRGVLTAPPAPPVRRSKPNAIFSLDERGVLRPPLRGPAAAGGLSSYSVATFAPILNPENPRPPPPNIVAIVASAVAYAWPHPSIIRSVCFHVALTPKHRLIALVRRARRVILAFPALKALRARTLRFLRIPLALCRRAARLVPWLALKPSRPSGSWTLAAVPPHPEVDRKRRRAEPARSGRARVTAATSARNAHRANGPGPLTPPACHASSRCPNRTAV